MENNEKAYYEKVDIDNELKLRKQLAALPPYCKQYFIAIESKTQSRTRLAYAYDLSCFFDYLHENNPVCKKMSITEIPLSILESLKPMDLEEYLDLVIDCVSLLPPELVIHRITGDGPKDLLIAPLWASRKREVLNLLHHRMKEGQHYQGKLYTI